MAPTLRPFLGAKKGPQNQKQALSGDIIWYLHGGPKSGPISTRPTYPPPRSVWICSKHEGRRPLPAAAEGSRRRRPPQAAEEDGPQKVLSEVTQAQEQKRSGHPAMNEHADDENLIKMQETSREQANNPIFMCSPFFRSLFYVRSMTMYASVGRLWWVVILEKSVCQRKTTLANGFCSKTVHSDPFTFVRVRCR